ncbi:MAG: prenyltransferase/squalene oxidase repeat-containing protein [Chloroflexota bacterium]
MMISRQDWMSLSDNRLTDALLTEMSDLIANLGRDGGRMSPSIYDTAQVLRFSPPETGVEPALDWLLSQQHSDGGWGNPVAPLTRDIPTLAAILALYTYSHLKPESEAIEAGLRFLYKQGNIWLETLREDLPVGIELIIPKLLADAIAMQLNVPHEQYEALLPIADRKLKYIDKMGADAATSAIFSWEAWGKYPTTDVLDETGGVGHNPAATAYWLYLTEASEDLTEAREAAKNYLVQASQATGLNIPGIVPTAWPITRFEQSLSLHGLLMSGLLDHPVLKPEISNQLQDMAISLRADGLGFSDFFEADGDDTGAALATLKASGYDISAISLDRFKIGDSYKTYPHELQGSSSATARGVQAMALFNQDVVPVQKTLVDWRHQDGYWPGDKWNISWLYTTLLSVSALTTGEIYFPDVIQSAADALQANQRSDGGWGINGQSTAIDTAYAILAISILRDFEDISSDILERGHQWFLHNWNSSDDQSNYRWLNKQVYSPYTVDRVFELSARYLLASEFSQ